MTRSGEDPAHQAASDAIGPLIRWLALRPDPADLHLLCPGSAARPRGARDTVAVRLDVCAADLPLSALLELALAAGRTVTLYPHDLADPGSGPASGGPAGPHDHDLATGEPGVPRPDSRCAARPAADGVARALAVADELLRAAGRRERLILAAAAPDRSRRRWRPGRPAPVLGTDDLALPRRAVLLPVVGTRRPGGRGRAANERVRLLDALAVLGPGAREAALELDVREAAPGWGVREAAPGGREVALEPVARGTVPGLNLAAVPSGPERESAAEPDGAPGTACEGHPAESVADRTRDPAHGSAMDAEDGSPVDAGGGSDQGCTGDGPGAAAPPAAAVLRADGCDACGVCVRACPAGALTLTPRGGLLRLEHSVSACTDCGRCVDLCPAGALTRTGQAPWSEVIGGTVVTLATRAVVTCRRCRGSYPPDGATGKDAGLCPVCRFRRGHPFGSTMPAAPARPGP